MTTAVQAKTLSQIEDTIAEGAPALIPVIANVVRQYLFPDQPKGWITEWSGAHGHHVMTKAVKTATRLTPDIVHIIVEYLRKNDIFGLEDVEKAAGGKAELTELIGPYYAQVPLPLEIDDEMQAPLSQYFDEVTLRDFHEYRTSKGMPQINKMTELYSLYWCPEEMALNSAEQLGKKHSAGFVGSEYFLHHVRQEHGNAWISRDCWIAFPNDVFGRSKTILEQEALTPAGFEFPHVRDAIFCVFVRFGCTGVRIMSQAPWTPCTYTRCQEKALGFKLAAGSFFADGLCVSDGYYDHESTGVALMRKFCVNENQWFAFQKGTKQRQFLGLDPSDPSPSESLQPTVPSPRIEQALGNEWLAPIDNHAPLQPDALEPVVQAGEAEEPVIDNPLEPQDEPVREPTLWEETVAVFTAILDSIVGWFCWFAKLLRSAFETT